MSHESDTELQKKTSLAIELVDSVRDYSFLSLIKDRIMSVYIGEKLLYSLDKAHCALGPELTAFIYEHGEYRALLDLQCEKSKLPSTASFDISQTLELGENVYTQAFRLLVLAFLAHQFLDEPKEIILFGTLTALGIIRQNYQEQALSVALHAIKKAMIFSEGEKEYFAKNTTDLGIYKEKLRMLQTEMVKKLPSLQARLKNTSLTFSFPEEQPSIS